MHVDAQGLRERLRLPHRTRLHDPEQRLPRPVAVEAEARGRRAVARGQGELLGPLRVVGVALAGPLGSAAVAREDLLDPERGPLGDLRHLLGAGLSQGVEHERRARISAHVDAIEHEHVEVDIEPQGGVSALDHAHRSRQRLLPRAQVERPLRAVLQTAGELHDERVEHLGAQLPVVAAEDPQPPRERAHPLSHGDLWEDSLHEAERRIRHAPAKARWAESSPFAAESDEPLQAAPVARDAHAARFQAAAAQIVLDLAHHETRQPAGLLGALAKRGPVRLDRPVEHRLFGTVALVAPLGVVVRESALSHGRADSGRVVPACASPASW